MAATQQVTETFFDEGKGEDREEKRASRSRRPSFRKTLSLITDSRRISTDTLAAEPLSPSSPRPRKSFSFSKRSSTPGPEHPLPPSQYYQDPEARLKLKTFLASPQNFDQALQLGFPSAVNPETSRGVPRLPSIPKLETDTSDTGAQNFLGDASFFDDDDRSIKNDDHDNEDEHEYCNAIVDEYVAPRDSFEEANDPRVNGAYDEDDDDRSIPEYDSPITPHDRMDSSLEEPRIARASPEKLTNNASHGRQAWDEPQSMWTGDRDMTLRMTLTKPELRAPEEQLYRWQRSGRGDPLALEALPAMKDHSALQSQGHGRKASATVEGSKVRGLWRRMRTASKG